MKIYYGVPGEMVDVTEKITSLVNDGKYTLEIGYNDMFGDPSPGREKVLVFEEAGEKKFSFSENNLPLYIDMDKGEVKRLYQEKKYFLSVAAIFKNETVALEEWIKHYLREGVEHFYLIDNGSTDNYKEIVEKYKDKITLYLEPRPYLQTVHYNKYFSKHNGESEWIILVDLDEFVYARKGYTKISDYLATLPEEVSRVVMFWKNFGSNGHIEQPSSIIQGFTRRYPLLPNLKTHILLSTCSKCIFRSKKVLGYHQHLSSVEGKSIFPNGKEIDANYGNILYPPFQKEYYSTSLDHALHINHYRIQSYKWFKEVKCTRGDVTNAATNNFRDDKYFKDADTNQEEDLELAQKVY